MVVKYRLQTAVVIDLLTITAAATQIELLNVSHLKQGYTSFRFTTTCQLVVIRVLVDS